MIWPFCSLGMTGSSHISQRVNRVVHSPPTASEKYGAIITSLLMPWSAAPIAAKVPPMDVPTSAGGLPPSAFSSAMSLPSQSR